jgi:hypothetical protein
MEVRAPARKKARKKARKNLGRWGIAYLGGILMVWIGPDPD